MVGALIVYRRQHEVIRSSEAGFVRFWCSLAYAQSNNMMKPIEPGCLAVIIGGHPINVGKQVRVGNKTSHVGLFSGSIHWRIDRTVEAWKEDGTLYIPRRTYRRYAEKWLMRIDGYDEADNKVVSDEVSFEHLKEELVPQLSGEEDE